MSSIAAILLWATLEVLPTIDVVYPRISPGDTIPYIARVDSNFIFGSVQPAEARLWINDIEVDLYPNGAFLAFQPVDWKQKHYVLKAVHESDTTISRTIFTTKPEKAASTAGIPVPEDYPRLIELSGQPLRTDPKGTYFIFPTSGTRVLTTGYSAGYFQIPLTVGRSAWVERSTIKNDRGKSAPLDKPAIWKIEIDTLGGGASLFIPVDRKLLFKIADHTSPDRITLELFGAVSHVDRISYPPGTEFIREVTWEQTFDGCIELDIKLTSPLWGYSSRWDEKGLTLFLRPSPAIGRRLQGMRIAIDPGHGGSQDGAIGPTRLKEKQANLACAQALAERLRQSGATVFLTLDQDSTLGLIERTYAAANFNADLLISLHHNALPDGVNPFGDYGVGTHYYRSQSRDLALSVQREVVLELGLHDEGVYYDDLALVRPTSQPAILLEAAYMMLPEQEALIGSQDYPNRLARAVEKGITSFVHERLTKRDR